MYPATESHRNFCQCKFTNPCVTSIELPLAPKNSSSSRNQPASTAASNSICVFGQFVPIRNCIPLIPPQLAPPAFPLGTTTIVPPVAPTHSSAVFSGPIPCHGTLLYCKLE